MAQFKYRMCVIANNPTPRQKVLMTTLLRDSEFPVIAMDEHNASVQRLIDKAEKLILFRPYTGACPNQADYMQRLKYMGWTRDRVIVEGTDFPKGGMPGDPVTEYQKYIKSVEVDQPTLRSDEEWEQLTRAGIPLPERVVEAFGREK